MKTSSLRRVCLALAVVAAAGAASGDELFRQNPVGAAGGFSSQDARNAGGLGWFSEVTDNFSVTDAATITAVEFWGGYGQTTRGNTHGFMIRFYQDAGGTVGNLISTQDVMTFTETTDFTNAQGDRLDTVLTLNTPVALPAAGQYWMSVVAILDRGGTSTEPQWGWVQATSNNLPSARQIFFGSQLTINADVAFVITGTIGSPCGSADFDGDGDTGTDADIEAFFACLAGNCCATCGTADFDGDGDTGTDADIEAFFRVLAGGNC